MSDIPAQVYHLGRLGQAGDTVAIATTPEQREQLAALADMPRLDSFSGSVVLKKISANRYELDFTLVADPVQACVVTLADVPAHIEKTFTRELHFSALSARVKRELEDEIIVSPEEDGQPEEIDSLHFDLLAPMIEEFLLALATYPRAPGVAFEPLPDPDGGPESPFAALKGLKSRP